MTLEEILQKFFNCNKPFLKRRRISGYWHSDPQEPQYEYLTSAGGKAYGKLTDLLYALEHILGKDFDANRWIEILDQIVQEGELT